MTYQSYRHALLKGNNRWTCCVPCINAGQSQCWTYDWKLSKHPRCPNCNKLYKGETSGQGPNKDKEKHKDNAGVVHEQESIEQLTARLVEEEDEKTARAIREKIKAMRAGNETNMHKPAPAKLGDLQAKKEKLDKRIQKEIETLQRWAASKIQKEDIVAQLFNEQAELEVQIQTEAGKVVAKPADKSSFYGKTEKYMRWKRQTRTSMRNSKRRGLSSKRSLTTSVIGSHSQWIKVSKYWIPNRTTKQSHCKKKS